MTAGVVHRNYRNNATFHSKFQFDLETVNEEFLCYYGCAGHCNSNLSHALWHPPPNYELLVDFVSMALIFALVGIKMQIICKTARTANGQSVLHWPVFQPVRIIFNIFCWSLQGLATTHATVKRFSFHFTTPWDIIQWNSRKHQTRVMLFINVWVIMLHLAMVTICIFQTWPLQTLTLEHAHISIRLLKGVLFRPSALYLLEVIISLRTTLKCSSYPGSYQPLELNEISPA